MEIIAILPLYLWAVWASSRARAVNRHGQMRGLLASSLITLGTLAAGNLIYGLSWDEMGIGWPFAAVIALFTAASIIIHFAKNNKLSFSKKDQKTAHKIFTEIPLQTCLVEEALFRSIILGWLMMHYSDLLAAALSALLFGLWHIPVAADFAKKHGQIAAANKWANLLVNIAFTGIAGLSLALVRIELGGILIPYLMHWAGNSVGVLFSRYRRF